VVKYIGDAVFAFWNAPEPQEDHALRACEAALDFRDKNKVAINGEPLVTRIGLHTGLARVGNFGSNDRVDYTALGESVNLASRLEGLNKFLGTKCLISQDTFQALNGKMVTRNMGGFRLKGFDTHVDVHELVGRLEQEESSRTWRESFARALENYQNKNLEFAAMGFQETLELRPEDGPSLFYLAKIEELQSQSIPEDWSGQTQLFEK
jgi:adenylate cyclase